MLDVDRCRELLGAEGADLTDREVAIASEVAWELAKLLLDMRPPKLQPAPQRRASERR